MTVIQHEQHQDTKLSKKYIYKYIVAIFSSQCLHINLYIVICSAIGYNCVLILYYLLPICDHSCLSIAVEANINMSCWGGG